MADGGTHIALASPRYVVTEVKGFLTAARGTGKPGTSFHVIDRHRNHQLVGTWRTEDFGRGGLSAIERARSRAEALATKLNQASPVQVVPRHVYAPFRPTCPHEACAVRCDSDALYCAECGARLYTLESGRYGAKS